MDGMTKPKKASRENLGQEKAVGQKMCSSLEAKVDEYGGGMEEDEEGASPTAGLFQQATF